MNSEQNYNMGNSSEGSNSQVNYVNQPNYSPTSNSNGGNGNNKIIIVILSLVLLALLAIVLVLLFDKKKDENTTNTTTTTKNITESSSNSSSNYEEDDSRVDDNIAWISGKFSLAGENYELSSDYKLLAQNGWFVDFSKYGYSDGYILNKGDKLTSTINLENKKYDDAEVYIGFVNLSNSAKDVSECQFWSIEVDNSYSDTPVDFELPEGIKTGSTIADIVKAYGKLSDDDIYRSDELGYTVYNYEYDFAYYLTLEIDDEKGLQSFSYKKY